MNRVKYAVPPNEELEIMRVLQGFWCRADDKISFVIDGKSIKDIKTAAEIGELEFLLGFNSENKKWQLTAAIFGAGSTIISLKDDAFAILIGNGQGIHPKIDITEVFHNKVWFIRPGK